MRMTGGAPRSQQTSIGKVIARGGLIVIGAGVGGSCLTASPLIGQASVRCAVNALGAPTTARSTAVKRTAIARRLRWPEADAAKRVLRKIAVNPDLGMVETVDPERRPVELWAVGQQASRRADLGGIHIYRCAAA
jgi:hypothetical protein